VSRSFDLYGNVTQLTENGITAEGGDERTTFTLFEPNTSRYIVDRPKVVILRAGSDDTGTILRRTQYRYDGHGNVNAAPTVGDLTRIDRNTGSDSYTTWATYTYDGRGNLLDATDTFGNTTTTTYDADFALFPIEVSNPKNQKQQFTWGDYACGKPLRSIDINGLTTRFTYDPLCRETRRSVYDGDDELGIWQSTSYNFIGDPAAQYIDTRVPTPGTSPSLSSTSRLDGLGRAPC